MKKRFGKRWISSLLAAALVFALMPQAVMAEEDDPVAEQDADQGAEQDSEQDADQGAEQDSEQDADQGAEQDSEQDAETGNVLTAEGGELAAGEYYLAEDISLTEDITIPEDEAVTIDLNGYTLTGEGEDSVITVCGALLLLDGSEDKTGRIEGDGERAVLNYGVVTMNGGTLSGSGYDGGAVYNAEDAVFEIMDGSVSGSRAENCGGGVYNAGIFIISGTELSGNSARDCGGAVYNAAGAEMSVRDCEISGNTVEDPEGVGAGIYKSADSLLYIGGVAVIEGNSVGDLPDNVYLEYDEEAEDCFITLDGELEEGSLIGVTADPEAGDPAQITAAESDTVYYALSARYFFSDGGYFIQANPVGRYVELVYCVEELTGVFQADDGNWYYYIDGEIQSEYTGFVSTSSGDWYIEAGELTFAKNSVIKDTAGALGTEGTWYYVTESTVRYDYTGVADYKNGNGWWYISEGIVDFDYNGFGENKNGLWYVENGKVTFEKNSVIKDTAGAIGDPGLWYYVVGSKVQTDFTGLADYKNSYGWWYIRDGVVDFDENTVAKNKNGWWYVTGGKVQFGFTGLADYKNANGWWYIVDGKVDFTHNGVDKNKNGWWYVTGGKVQFGFTGLADYKNANGWWYIEGGKVDFTAQGVYKNKNGWWYVVNGKVDFTFHGMAKNDNGWWYIVNGKVDFSFNGTVSAGGVSYTVKNGKVDR